MESEWEKGRKRGEREGGNIYLVCCVICTLYVHAGS